MRRHIRTNRATIVAIAIVAATSIGSSQDGLQFYDDDPMMREPETQDASHVEEWDIDLFLDLVTNLFGRPGDSASNVRARNVNTIDEVPDSSWFTNRILRQPLSADDVARGPGSGKGPAPGIWTVVRPKEAGFAPGFTMQDSAGDTWFVSFDAHGYPEAATGALLVANKIFWALGYWQVENHLITIRPDTLAIGDSAIVKPPSGKRRRMKRGDLDAVLRRAHRSPDGSYRAVAGRALPGRPLGGFRYHGTRPDDPNDVVPHEHRRELRALKVFGAWTNLVDMKAGNTLDVLVTEGGHTRVRHYLQDVGSTFGTGANAPREYDEGWEYLYEGDLLLKRLASVGLYLRPWQTVSYERHAAIGRFEAETFDPLDWRPRVPTAALLQARHDDNFWAARRVAAFSDDMIRTIVKTGQYSDPTAERYLGDVLIHRRQKIAQAYLAVVNPLVDFALDGQGRLTFQNAAAQAGVSEPPSGGYSVSWARFDNRTRGAVSIGRSDVGSGDVVQAPAALPDAPGAWVKLEIAAKGGPHPSWSVPVDVYFRRTTSGWTLIGLERLP